MSQLPLHILLVEDNLDHAELVRRQLEAFTIASQIHHVADGEAALAYIFGQDAFAARHQFPAPAVVLLDLRLPRLSGLEVLRQVKARAEHQSLPIVVLTTSEAEQDVQCARVLGAHSLLTKPTDSATLGKLFRELGLVPLGGAMGVAPEENLSPA